MRKENKKEVLPIINIERIQESKDSLLALSDMVADAVLQRMTPVKDDLSQREATAEYGARFIAEALKKKLISFRKFGNRKVYSRRELNAVRYSVLLSVPDNKHEGVLGDDINV